MPTTEEITRHYLAALDSVALLNGVKPETTTQEDWADTVKRNVDHLKIMVAKDYWVDQDLTPLTAAIALHEPQGTL